MNDDGEEDIPDEKIIDTDFVGMTFLPGNFGVEDIGENGS